MKHRISGSVLIRGSRSGRAGGLTTVTQPSLPTETYTWWADGTLKSLPGTGVTRNLDYNENGQLTSISHNTTAKFEFAYAYDGARRSSKDLTSGVWTWFPCGVQCSAGELVTLTSTNNGGSWATSSTNLAAASCGGGVVRTGTDFILRDLFGNVAETRNASNTVIATAVFDAFGVQRFGTGTLSAGVLRNTYGDNNEDGMSAFLRGRRVDTRSTKPKIDYVYKDWPIYDGRPWAWGYGNWCGHGRGGGTGGRGLPIDQVDGCCMQHDACLTSVIRIVQCSNQICDCLRSANCGQDELCQRARRDMWRFFCQFHSDPPRIGAH